MAKPTSHPQLSLQSAHLHDDAAGIPPDHWSRVFFEQVHSAFRDADFAAMYQEGGRYPVSPSLLASISILQYMQRVSDRVAVDNTIMRRDWRIALGITPNYAGFDASVLCNFRKRLVAHNQTRLIFERVLECVQELGLIKRHHRVRVDATELIANVAVLSRAESLMEAIRVVVHDAYKQCSALRQRADFMSLHERHGDEVWLGRTSSGDQKLTDLARDAQALLLLCKPYKLRGQQVLAQMLQENFVFDASGEPQALRVDERPADHIVTPHEPDVRVGKKGHKLWTGDKVHIVETVQPGEQSFLVDMVVTPPYASDDAVLPALALRTVARSPHTELMIADGGYASASNSHLTDRLGLDLLSRPGNSNRNMRIPIEAFAMDFESCVAVCPQGHRSMSWREAGRTYRIAFAKRDCDACPLRSECTTNPDGRTITPSIHYPELQRERARFQQAEAVELYKQRAGIEGTFSKLVHQCGLRRSRYRGAAKRTLHALLAGAALNVLRLLRCQAQIDQTAGPLSGVFPSFIRALAGGHRPLQAQS
jgi:transposase